MPFTLDKYLELKISGHFKNGGNETAFPIFSQRGGEKV